MTEPTIVCPKCKAEIKLTESLAAPRADFHAARAGHHPALRGQSLRYSS